MNEPCDFHFTELHKFSVVDLVKSKNLVIWYRHIIELESVLETVQSWSWKEPEHTT